MHSLASLGPSPNILEQLSTRAKAVGLNPDDEKHVDAAATRLTAVLRDMPTLLIIDHAWTADAAEALMVGGVRRSTVVTTRFRDVGEFACRKRKGSLLYS